MVGSEGDLERLLVKARFEEAKKKELDAARTPAYPKKATGGNAPGPTQKSDSSVPPPRSDSKPQPVGSRNCYNCGMTGHMIRNCPYPKQQRGDKEARPRKNSAVATITAGEATQSQKSQIAELRQRLHEAELAAAVEEATATLRVVHSTDSGGRAKLGPTITASICVNGVKTEALLDTGSPTTVMSLKFALEVLAQERPKFNTVEEWSQAVKLRFGEPSVVLKSYGGARLNVIAQLQVTLSQGEHSTNALVLVQKDAPNALLVGTDLLSLLGFSMKRKAVDEELLEPKQDATPQEESSERPTSVVKLLQAVRIPAWHRKMVRVKVSGWSSRGLSLFTPAIDDDDLTIEDAVVQMEQGDCLTLIAENRGLTPMKLKKDMTLGGLEPVELEESDSVEGRVAAVAPDQKPGSEDAVAPGQKPGSEDRVKRLMEQLELEIGHLSGEEQQGVRDLVHKYCDVFALDPSELGTTSLVTHVIDTGDHAPVRQRVRRTPFALRDKVDQMVQDMLQDGIIQPSRAPWASPIVLVRKKDGGIRFCVDYRQLNRLTKLDVFPLPRIDDTLDLLSGARYFTTLDLASGYWQVAMDPVSREKTAFITTSGLFEFRKMPFGLVNAPATFQRLMEIVLSGLAREGCLVYLDDVIVMGSTLEEHNANLTKVLDRLREAGLMLKPQKCKIAQTQVEYLGHIVSGGGIHTDLMKLQAVSEFPRPTNLKALRSFLGLTSYYRRFIPNFARVAAPLHALTKKDAEFAWTTQCAEAFDRLKSLLTSAPVLAFPDFRVPFILETDASGNGLGAVLAQRQEDGSVRPVAYASRSLQDHEKRYGVTELEGLGVVWSVKHFRPYLYGHQCDIYTDHQALKSLLNTPQPSGKLARWGMAIQELDVRILHRSGKHNDNADSLSRFPLLQSFVTDEPCGVVAAVEPQESRDGLADLQREDQSLAEVITYLETGVLPADEKQAKTIALTCSQYTMKDGVLYYVDPDCTLRVIPPTSTREKLFQQAHGGAFGGHLGEVKVHSELRRHYWWLGMRADIGRWTRACLVCASHSTGRAVRPPLTPIPVGGPFDRVGVDIIQFPRSHDGHQYCVVFMDYLTKWPEAFAVSNQTAATVAKLLVEEVVSRYGVPAEVLSDRGSAFLSGLMKEVTKLLGLHQVNTTAYHPQTDGLVERFNRTLTAMLAKTTERGGRDWDKHLPFVLFAYRATQQQSTQESPFFLVYGRDPRLPVEDLLSTKTARNLVNLKDYGSDLATKMSRAWDLARQCVGKAQKKQKSGYDRMERRPTFTVGERVFLFKPAEKTGPARKLARPFHGPYRVVKMDTNTAHVRRVDRPQDESILVSISRLRRCPDEIPDLFWPTKGPTAGVKDLTRDKRPAPDTVPDEHALTTENVPVEDRPHDSSSVAVSPTSVNRRTQPTTSKWAGRLRHQPRTADS